MNQLARTPQQIGAIIRRARRHANLTQADLGKKIGLRQATISKLEKGGAATQLGTLFDVLTALGLEIKINQRNKAESPSLEDIF